MAEWVNSDGLRVRFGTDEANVTRGGVLPAKGGFVEWVFNVKLTDATTGSALIPRTTGILIPKGYFMEEVEVFTETAVTSAGSATFNLGLLREDTTTTYDADGFLAAVAKTDWDTVGETQRYRVGSTGAGAFLGTELANAGWLCMDWDTAAYTAGEIRVVIRGFKKRPAATN